MSRHHGWIFTINNPTERDHLLVEELALSASYLVAGNEIGEEMETPHIQGYVRLSSPTTRLRMSKYLPRARLEPAKVPVQAMKYCMKDGDFKEWGTRPQDPKEQGKKEKKRWEDIWQSAKRGDIENIPADVIIRHYSSLMRIKKDYMNKPQDLVAPCGIWIWGKPGVGKSFGARRDYPGSYFKPANKWWDGYQGESSVILDDLDPKHSVLAHHLKIWADAYSFIAEIKGGAQHIRPQVFIVTSQYSPEQVFSDPEDVAAIRRRFKVTHLLDNNLE